MSGREQRPADDLVVPRVVVRPNLPDRGWVLVLNGVPRLVIPAACVAEPPGPAPRH